MPWWALPTCTYRLFFFGGNLASYSRNLPACHLLEDSDGRRLVIKIWSYAPNDRFGGHWASGGGGAHHRFYLPDKKAKPSRSCIVRCWGAKHCPGHSQNMGLPLVKHKFGGWKTSEVLATGRHKGNDGGKKSMRFS